MTQTVNAIMTFDGQQLPSARSLREAVGIYLRRHYPDNTSGNAAKALKLPKSTIANLLKGHASDGTLTHVFRQIGWRGTASIVGAVIGQSLEEHLDKELEAIRAERTRLDGLERAAQARWNVLAANYADIAREARTAVRPLGSRPGEVGDRPALAPNPVKRGRGA